MSELQEDENIELPEENEVEPENVESTDTESEVEGPESPFPETAPELTPEEQVEKWRDLAARSQADLENYRKRMAREKTEAIVYANRGLLESLFPIIDNFEMGLRAAKDNDGEDSIIYQGMAMVFRQIQDFLTDNGVTEVESEGKAFDPNLHEAIKQEASDTIPEGNIIFVARRGYRLKERILRAATVVVSSGAEEAAEEKTEA